MPLYEYTCDNEHTTEKLFPIRDVPSVILCKCGLNAEMIVSVPYMKPDKHWHGTTTPTGVVVNSEKEYQEAMKNVAPATRDNQEWVERRKQDALKDLERKKEQRRNKFFSSIAHSIDLPA